MAKTTHSKIRSYVGTLSLTLAGQLGLFSPAMAQIDTNAPAISGVETNTARRLDRVVVTGSNIPTAATEPAAPVDVYTAEDIARSGATTTESFLRRLPSAVGAGNFGQARSNGGNGTANVGLRGLPSPYTLVLINGRRAAPDGFAGSTVDLNTIPLAAIERIDILKDGASAIYGSDAVAGVVNVILKKGYNGLDLEIYYGNTTDSDVGRKRGSIVYGVANTNTSALFVASFSDDNSLYSRDREISKSGDFRRFGGTDQRSGHRAGRVSSEGLILRSGVDVPTSAADYRPFADKDFFNFAEFTPAFVAQTRAHFLGSIEHDLIEKKLQLFTDFSYAHTTTDAGLAPTPVTSVYGNITGIPVAASNPHNVFGTNVTVRYRTLELGLRTDEFVGDNYRFVGGLKGEINPNWHWEGAVTYAEDNRVETFGGILNKSAFTNAINDGTFNPFARNTDANRLALQPALINTVRRGKSTVLAEDVLVNGSIWDLPAGNLGFAAGGGNRRESVDDVPDSQTGTGNTIGATNFELTRGNRDVQHAFAELQIPIFSEANSARGAHVLEFNLAARVENYSDVDTRPLKPKVSMRWQPLDDSLTLRATWGQGFRAPSLSELHAGTSESFDTINDPSGLTADRQVAVVSRGNSRLSPERSESYTFGVVYSPPVVKGVTLNVDYFRYNLDSVIQSGSQFLVNEQFRTGSRAQFFTNGLFSDPNQPLFVERDPASGAILSVQTQTRNVAKIEIKGIDAGIQYEFPTDGWGKFTYAMNAQYLLTFKQQDAPGGPYVDYLGDFSSTETNPQGFGSIPRLRAVASIFWDFDRYAFGATANYIDAYLDDKLAGVDRQVSEYVTLDLQGSVRLPYNTKITVGVDNLLDVEPPFAAGAFADGYDRDLHSLLGRFVYASVTKKF